MKDGGSLSKSESEKEKSLSEKKAGLEDGIKSLEEKEEYVKKEKFEKYIKLMKTTVESANTVLTKKEEASDVTEEAVVTVIGEAKSFVAEIKAIEEAHEKDIIGLSATFTSLSTAGPVEEDVERHHNDDTEEEFKREIENLAPYLRDRFRKIEKEIVTKMREQIIKLESTWK